jgi:hypothetical protein
MQQTLSAAAREFLAERHLATLTTLRADGSPHVVPVGFTYDVEPRGVVRVITFAGRGQGGPRRRRTTRSGVPGRRRTVAHARGSGHACECRRPTSRSRAAVAAYAVRYRQPKVRDDRVVVEIDVDKVMCNSGLRSGDPS